jgi:hypothetical protein
MRKYAAAAGLLMVSVALCAAEDIRAVITKVDGNKVTFHKLTGGGKGKKPEKGEATTLTIASDAKIIKGKFNRDTKKVEDGDALENGLKNERFTKGDVGATLTTSEDGKTITKVRVRGERKKKKADVE